jgi:hypothetical protein
MPSDANDSSLTRHLKTASWPSMGLPTHRLEQPNLIQGVAAAGRCLKTSGLEKIIKSHSLPYR